jgi:hypothetical protein
VEEELVDDVVARHVGQAAEGRLEDVVRVSEGEEGCEELRLDVCEALRAGVRARHGGVVVPLRLGQLI